MTSPRRRFLHGAGGACLALPFLPSLLPRGARAAAPGGPTRPVLMAQKQGAYFAAMHGDAADRLPNRGEFVPGHGMAWGPIPRAVQNGRTVVSKILQADAAVLGDRLLGKMNVIRGLDCVSADGHNASPFGNLTKDEAGGIPSIDQIAAWSPAYNRPGSFRERCIVAGYAGFSFDHANPASRSGPVQRVASVGDPQKLFDRVFASFMPAAPVAPAAPSRRPLVDHVFEDYRMIRQSNRRLSAEDRRRLDGHVEMMAELQRRISGAGGGAMGAGCARPVRATKSYGYTFVKKSGAQVTPAEALRTPAESIELHRLYNDVIAAAFKCGLTRLAMVAPYEKNDPFSSYRGNGHGLAHEAGGSGAAQAHFTEAYQSFFEGVLVDLARKLDVEEAPGRTYLDGSLLVWTNEHGERSHNPMDKPMITFGSAGGFFKTGLFVDYRNRAKQVGPARGGFAHSAGILIHQFWANVLFALGIPRAEWDRYAGGMGAGKGFGPQAVINQEDGAFSLSPSHYLPGVFDCAGDRLPVLPA